MEKKVINNILPITTTKCVYIDGTSDTLHNYLDNANSISKYNNKKFLWLGDSISSGVSGYPTLVANNFNATLTNLASSGGDTARMRNICQGVNGYSKPNYNDIDYVFIMIGHNCDSFPKEDIILIPTDSTSFLDYPTTNHYCNIASCIEFIWNEKSDIEIFLITPIQSTNGRYMPTTLKAHNALREIGELYSVPVIDIYAISGICRRNIATYTSDNIHPNDLGKKKIADKIISQMLTY